MKKGKKKVRHSPSPWMFGSRNGEERGDSSEWGASGLWTKDNCLILGSGDGWSAEYQGPKEVDGRLIEAAPDLLYAAKIAVNHLRACLAGKITHPFKSTSLPLLLDAIAKAEEK